MKTKKFTKDFEQIHELTPTTKFLVQDTVDGEAKCATREQLIEPTITEIELSEIINALN